MRFARLQNSPRQISSCTAVPNKVYRPLPESALSLSLSRPIKYLDFVLFSRSPTFSNLGQVLLSKRNYKHQSNQLLTMSPRAMFLAAFLATVTTASASLTLSPKNAHIGMLTTLTFTLDQMCASSTDGLTSLTIQMPSSVVKVHVESVLGWAEQLTSNNVTFHGMLPSDHFQEFKLRVALSGAPGDIVYFYTYQDCFGHGPNLSWHAIPTEIDPTPTDAAPSVLLADPADSGLPESSEVIGTVTPVPSKMPMASYSSSPTNTPKPSATPSISTILNSPSPIISDSAVLNSPIPSVAEITGATPIPSSALEGSVRVGGKRDKAEAKA